MVDFLGVLDQWENMGVFNILLPFLLVFAITFAILEKIALFAPTGQKKQINGIIAAILGILVVRNQYIVGIINRFLPNVALFMIVILMFLLLVGIFSGQAQLKGSLLGLGVIVSFVFVIWSLTSDFVGDRYSIPSFLYGFDETTKATVIFIGIFIGVIYFVTREKDGESKPPLGKWLEALGGEAKP